MYIISKHYPLVDNFRNSHHLSVLQCIKIVRRIYILIIPGSERVNLSIHPSAVNCMLHLLYARRSESIEIDITR